MSKIAYWYCTNCHEEVDASRVTWQELHDACGHHVEWIEGISIDRLREICEAEQEGRLVVLPVPIGYPVYKANKDDYEECMPCAGNRCGCSFVRHDNNGLICGNKWTKCGFKITYIKFNYKHIPLFGKTVFLTREEAEGALNDGRKSIIAPTWSPKDMPALRTTSTRSKRTMESS